MKIFEKRAEKLKLEKRQPILFKHIFCKKSADGSKKSLDR